MPKFRKKPVVIEAVQWWRDGDHPAVFNCYFDIHGGVRVTPEHGPDANVAGLARHPAIKTLEGWHMVKSGDWIIRGVKGEFYPCKPDIFAETYEAVD